MTKTRKSLATLVVIGVTGALAAFGTYSAFTATTSNSNNSFTAGTVTLTNNDSGVAMFNAVTGGTPGVTVDRCIKVAYTGGIAGTTVKLYTSDSTGGSLQPYVDVTITPGTYNGTEPAFPSCTNFQPDAGPIYSGTLANFRTTKNSYANGVTGIAAPGTVYKFSYTVAASAPDSAQGTSTGSHSYTWEARSN